MSYAQKTDIRKRENYVKMEAEVGVMQPSQKMPTATRRWKQQGTGSPSGYSAGNMPLPTL